MPTECSPEDLLWERVEALKRDDCERHPASAADADDMLRLAGLIGAALAWPEPSPGRKEAVWEKVAQRIGLAEPAPKRERRPFAEWLRLPMPQRRPVRLGALGVAVVVLTALGLFLYPNAMDRSAPSTTPAAIASDLVEAWETVEGFHRVMIGRFHDGRVQTSDEWMQRPDKYKRIIRDSAETIIREELTDGLADTTYYPQANVVVYQRTLAVTLDKLARLAPREEACLAGILQGPNAQVLGEEQVRDRTCWIVDTGRVKWWVSKDDYMLMKTESITDTGETIVGNETVSAEFVEQLPSDTFTLDVPSSATKVYGPLLWDTERSPAEQVKPLGELRNSLAATAARRAESIYVPAHLPEGFGFVKHRATVGGTYTLFYNPATGGVLILGQDMRVSFNYGTPDAENTVSIGSLTGTLRTFEAPFRMLQLEFEREGSRFLVTASQLSEDDLLKVVGSLEPVQGEKRPEPSQPAAGQASTSTAQPRRASVGRPEWTRLNEARRAARDKDTERAEKLYREVIASQPDSTQCALAQMDLAQLLQGGGRTQEAIELYEQVVSRRDRYSAGAALRLAFVHGGRGDTEQEESAHQRAIELAPHGTVAGRAREGLGRLYEREGEPEKAAEQYERIVSALPTWGRTPAVLLLLAQLHAEDPKAKEKAIAAYQRLLTDYLLPPDTAAIARRQLIALAGEQGLPKPVPVALRVLIDESHNEASVSYLSNNGGSSNLGQAEVLLALKQAGYTVHSTPRWRPGSRSLTPELLSQYRTVIFNGRGGGRVEPAFEPKEIQQVKEFVREGGCLLVVSGGAKLGDGKMPEFYNPLVSPYGIEVVPDAALGQTATSKLTKHPVTKGLTAVHVIHGAQLRAKTRAAEVVGWCGEAPVLAVARFGKGKVVVFGGGSGLMGQGLNVQGPSKPTAEQAGANKKLLLNVVQWFAGDVDSR